MKSEVHSAESCAGCAAQAPVDRLTFLKQGAAMIAAVALAGCVDSLTAPDRLSATTVVLADNPGLAAVGGVITLSIDGSPVAVVRESSNAFAAFSLVCPHKGATVQTQASGFSCPRHGARFNLNGEWTGGQGTNNLRSYPVIYDSAAETLTVGG
jgi:thiosulfate dehydrogenase [quinone] large subunit